jgi:hypothetical protein
VGQRLQHVGGRLLSELDEPKLDTPDAEEPPLPLLPPLPPLPPEALEPLTPDVPDKLLDDELSAPDTLLLDELLDGGGGAPEPEDELEDKDDEELGWPIRILLAPGQTRTT